VETVDLDPDLNPDHVASVTDLPLPDNTYDACCAFQVLEHLPFQAALVALDELARVARNHVVISLPDSRRSWRYMLHLPRLGEWRMLLNRPQSSAPVHAFDGEHYWEINKRGYELEKVTASFLKSGKLRLVRTFRPFENTSHRFFIFGVVKSAAVVGQ
jgi:ubiquinone/menaquinone biosynthesis C-methylase UbiE